MSRYAENTEVSTDKSRVEIERILQRYGAPEDGFIYGRKGNSAFIGFEFHGVRFKIVLPLPDRMAEEFRYTPARRTARTPEQALAAWEQAGRQSWRALALVIKAKLEAVEAKIATFEDEFMAYRVLPSGRTVSEEIGPKLGALQAGQVPALFPALEVSN